MATIIRLDRINAGKTGQLEHMQSTTELNNGNVVVVGPLLAGEREIHEAKLVADIAKDEVVLVAAPELMYENYRGLKDFVVEANKAFRAYHLTVGDVITITADGITGTPVVGQYVIPAVGSVKLAASTDGGTARTKFLVEEKDVLGYDSTDAWVLRVVSV